MFIYILSCYIILAHSSDHCVCIAYRDMKHLESSECTQMKSQNADAHLLKFHTRAAQIRGFPREFVTLRVTQFVLKMAHLVILI